MTESGLNGGPGRGIEVTPEGSGRGVIAHLVQGLRFRRGGELADPLHLLMAEPFGPGQSVLLFTTQNTEGLAVEVLQHGQLCGGGTERDSLDRDYKRSYRLLQLV
ncbi:hypothetical protein JZ751_002617 [Albula glossodonta]|uniref:Uncharacterized protein n=1 Tax=Albula glossodonta TaxID=121402 RepID=A0A8T2NAB1_9TELE|nr:hypothetical protein JZ751_002617 [Albula glossodonta]